MINSSTAFSGPDDQRAIAALLARHGFRFSRAMGQHFLLRRDIVRAIADASGASAEHAVLEIGPGIGSLSAALCERAGKVVAVELDERLLPILRETMAAYGNFELIGADILKLDLPALVRERFAGYTPLVCANLPYQITSPALSALLEARCFERLTLLLQKEVALRLCAPPGTAAYGAFSVFLQYYTEPSIAFEVPRGCFTPPPNVDSALLCAHVREKPAVAVGDEAFFFRTVRAAFALRRKTLVNSLCAAFGDRLNKEEIARCVASCGLDPRVRGERLTLEQFAALSDALYLPFRRPEGV